MAEKTLTELRLDKRRFWKVHIRAWERSGFTQNEYCRRNKLRNNQFTYWKTKFNREHSAPVNFVPVPTNSTHQVAQSFDSRDSGLSVFLGTVEIKIANNFNPTCFSKVVSILEERS
jgi:hypothetical protein